MDNNFVVYGYLREKEDRFGRRGTLYYIGKGRPERPYVKYNRRVQTPKNKENIWIIHKDLDEDTALTYEMLLIDMYQRQDKEPETGILKNMTDGGEGSTGRKQTKETRRKISDKNKGQKKPESFKLKLSERNKNKVYTKEMRERMSRAKTGEKNPNYGKPRAEETRRRIAESNSKRINWYHPGRNIVVWASAKELIDMFPEDKLMPSSLSTVYTGRRNKHKNWIRAKKPR